MSMITIEKELFKGMITLQGGGKGSLDLFFLYCVMEKLEGAVREKIKIGIDLLFADFIKSSDKQIMDRQKHALNLVDR